MIATLIYKCTVTCLKSQPNIVSENLPLNLYNVYITYIHLEALASYGGSNLVAVALEWKLYTVIKSFNPYKPGVLSLCIEKRKMGLVARKTCLRGFANNKVADQPLHRRTLISALVIRLLESIMSQLASSEILNFLASLCS